MKYSSLLFIYWKRDGVPPRIRGSHNSILTGVLWYLQELLFSSSFPSCLSSNPPMILKLLDKSSLHCRRLSTCYSYLTQTIKNALALHFEMCHTLNHHLHGFHLETVHKKKLLYNHHLTRHSTIKGKVCEVLSARCIWQS